MTALVLSGGGARAAYQAGAIRAIAKILGVRQSPFRILAGISAGAINTVAVGIGSHDLPNAAERLTASWLSLTPSTVYRTDVITLGAHGARWFKDLTTGGLLGPSQMNHLLDTTPLRAMLTREIDMSRLREHIRSHLLHGIAVTATNYATGSTVTFFDGASDVEPWTRHGRVAIREPLKIEHVLASAAIPIFFPPVEIDGRFYGDGSIRMTTPLAPAIHLGARKILAIGIRYVRPDPSTVTANVRRRSRPVPVSAIAGVLLNSVFLDALDGDVERVERINRTLSVIPADSYQRLLDPLRRIPILALRPSLDLGRLAADQHRRFPPMLRFLLRGIGATETTGWDLVSYLAFLPEYVAKLLQLGFNDTLARRDEIEAFFAAPPGDAGPSVFQPPDTD